MQDKYGQVSLLDLLQIAWVALHESMPLLLLLFGINLKGESQAATVIPGGCGSNQIKSLKKHSLEYVQTEFCKMLIIYTVP